MTSQCRECKQDKCKVLTGRKRSNGQKVYVNEKQRQWNGNQCPDCKYLIRQECLGPNLDPNPLTHRKCRECNTKLRKDRYFTCDGCKTSHPEGVPYNDSDWGYECLYPFKQQVVGFSSSDLAIMG